jgi:hypothetical protein
VPRAAPASSCPGEVVTARDLAFYDAVGKRLATLGAAP